MRNPRQNWWKRAEPSLKAVVIISVIIWIIKLFPDFKKVVSKLKRHYGVSENSLNPEEKKKKRLKNLEIRRRLGEENKRQYSKSNQFFKNLPKRPRVIPNYDPSKKAELSDPFSPPKIEPRKPSQAEIEAIAMAKKWGAKKVYQGASLKLKEYAFDREGRFHYAPYGESKPKVKFYFEQTRFCKDDRADLTFVIYTYNGFSEYDPKGWSKEVRCGSSIAYRRQSTKAFK